MLKVSFSTKAVTGAKLATEQQFETKALTAEGELESFAGRHRLYLNNY